jgi:predicted O-linked N-acetylglucosamine transferase (SPINDLY family)
LNNFLDRKNIIDNLINLYKKNNLLECKKKLLELKIKFPDDYFLENFHGVISLDEGLQENAITLFKKSIQLNPNFEDSYLNLSKVFEKEKEFNKSIFFLENLLKIKKEFLIGNLRIANLYQKNKQFDKAILSLNKALELSDKKDYYIIIHNIGSCHYSLKDFKQAQKYFLKSFKLNNNFTKTLISLSLVCKKLNRMDESLYYLNLALKKNNNLDEVYKYLGDYYFDIKDYDNSLSSYKKSIEINPNNSEALESLAFMFYKLRKFTLAEEYYLQSLKINSNSIYSNLGIADTYLALLNHDKSTTYFENALKIDPNSIEVLQSYIFSSNYIPDFKKEYYLELTNKFYNLIKQEFIKKNLVSKKNKHIGFIAATFFQHAVSFQIKDIIKELVKLENIKVFAFSNFQKDDLVNKELKKTFHEWIDITSLKDDDKVKKIQDCEIDILIDLDGYTKNNSLKLFAFKPAPVQISWCGYLNSTGVKEIDFYIADPYVLPEKYEKFYSEKIIRLPNFFTCMAKVEEDLTILEESPAKKNNYVTFCCFSNTLKYNKNLIKCWSLILEQVKNARLILLDTRFSDHEYCKYILDFFSYGTNVIKNNRIRFEGFKNRKKLLELYNYVDIVLDTFPYGGMTTSLEAAYMGVPTLTVEGNSHLSRCTFSLNKSLGLNDFIASSQNDYINKAVELAKDINKIQETKSFLLKNRDTFDAFNSKKFAKEFLDLITNLK